MHTGKAFIRKNTEHLRFVLLNQLGYIYNSSEHNREKEENILYCVDGKLYSLSTPDYLSHQIVDCGVNDDLFLAIAALNDEYDFGQWFYSTGWTDFDGNPIPDKWILCDQISLEKFAYVNNSPNSYSRDIWKKATVKELIEHFK